MMDGLNMLCNLCGDLFRGRCEWRTKLLLLRVFLHQGKDISEVLTVEALAFRGHQCLLCCRLLREIKKRRHMKDLDATSKLTVRRRLMDDEVRISAEKGVKFCIGELCCQFTKLSSIEHMVSCPAKMEQNTGSQTSIGLARTWLDCCLSTHRSAFGSKRD
ncbi:uncharacterized protein LY89DRAFT_457799 [Mollisia scopiformis]|uniref:Uncharacterized protein n=1 Tax=Mollisia scopiformis TaxID=149040 RepID=A0A194XHR7_MOLSC|nr:uncharacterized protein LY89DRAFT_457799 [Mollisia scopiformis]KUJ19674.1 hypothetical protein LY89DRAFT_457799 [Mollisia scopiformis]